MGINMGDTETLILSLGLGYERRAAGGANPEGHPHRTKNLDVPLFRAVDHSLEVPSLTLALPDDVKDHQQQRCAGRQSTSQSPVSSFSNTLGPSSSCTTKREMGATRGVDEIEVEKLSYRNSDEDDDVGVRKKLRLTKEQSAFLEERFKEQSTLNPRKKVSLAKQLSLRPRQIEVWFQNRRARTKLKQTEVDREYLKRCCEVLADENRRLQREVQQLRALGFATADFHRPLFMQDAPATPTLVTMCPYCQRITTGLDGKASPASLEVDQKKTHFVQCNSV